jgi:hypothetical protein
MLSIVLRPLAVPLGKAELDLASIIVIVLVVAAVGLVVWASRPSVISRYSTANLPRDDEPAGPAEKKPRA